MKIKKLGIGLLLLAGTLALGSCVKNKKVNPTDTGTTPVTTDTTTDPKTTVTDPITGSTKPTSPTEPTLPPQTDVTIDPIEDESLINSIYVDFNKATLPKTYVPFVKEVFSSSLNLDAEEQKALINNYSCISAKGVQIENEEETPFLIDSALKLSTNESYIGFVLTPIVVNMTDYVNDLIAYEEEQYGEISTPTYYVFQNKTEKVFIISIESKDGSNRDLVVINESGIGSYINYSSKDYKFETVLENKTALSDSDLATLNNVPCIRYNNDGCLYRVTDYSITDLVIPGSYRTIPFNDLEINDLDKCYNLANVSLNGFNKYTIIDGVIYNKDLTELLYYPKAKEAESFEILDSVTEIRFGVFKNLKNLKELIYSDGISSIRNFEFENSNLEKIVMNDSITEIGNSIFKGCRNLKDITIPFAKGNASLLEYFQTEEDSSLNEVLYNNTTYYLPSIESLNLLHGDISELTFLGISDSLTNIILSDDVTKLDNTNFVGSFTNLKSITALGCKSVSESLFKFKVNLEEANFSLETIGSSSFAGCENLKIIDLSKLTNIPDNAFGSCTSLESISIPNVTAIGEKAFKYSGVKHAIGSNVTSIGTEAFMECKNLINANLPLVTIVPYQAFNNCTKLESVYFDSLTTIEQKAFRDCSSLKTFGANNIKLIGEESFYNCSALTAINLKSYSDTYIPEYAFYKCNSLSSFSLSSTVTEIKRCAFFDCDLLKSFDFSNIKRIETYAFYDCQSLTSVEMTGSYIGIHAFSSCNNLETVKLNISGTIDDNAFYNISSLKTFISSNASTVIGETIIGSTYLTRNSLESVNIASTNLTKRLCVNESQKNASITLAVTSLSSNNISDLKLFGTVNINSVTNANNIFPLSTYLPNCTSISANKITTIPSDFQKNTKLQSISFNKVTTIEAACFRGCTNLKSASFSSLTTIGNYAFDGCKLLESFDFGNCTTTGENTFNGCENLETVSGSKITTVDNYCFEFCGSLKNVNFANNLTKIGHYAFYHCESLTSFSNNKNIEIRDSAFRYCTSLETIYLPSLTILYPDVFSNCTSLKTYTLTNATKMGGGAFENCTSLTSFASSKITEFGLYGDHDSLFKGCTSLKTVNLPNLTEVNASMFAGCTALSSLTTGKITGLYSNCFENCTSLKTIDLSSCTFIGSSAFMGCTALTDVTCSTAITKVSEHAFDGCTSLSNLTNLTGAEAIEKYAFYNCSSLTKYVASDALKTIGDYAFYGCTKLSSISNFNSIETIGEYAFYNCSKLSSQPWYTLNQNNPLRSIGAHAFEYTCLWNITLGDSISSIGTDAFKNLKYINSNITSQTLNITYNSTTYSLLQNMSSSSCGSLFSNNVNSFLIYSYSSSYPLSTLEYYHTGYIYNYYNINKTYTDGSSYSYIWFKKK